MSTGLARLAGLAGCTFRAELAEVAVAATARRPNARGAGHIGFCLGVWAVKPRDASVAAASPGPPRGAVTTDTTRATGATVAAITE